MKKVTFNLNILKNYKMKLNNKIYFQMNLNNKFNNKNLK